MALADVLILYDTAQFVRREYHNRNRIKGPEGVRWLTVPVNARGIQSIRDIRTDESQPWRHRVSETIHACYRRAPYYREYAPQLEDTLEGHANGSLAELNAALIHYLRGALGLRTELRLASDLPVSKSSTPTGRLIQLTRAVHGDTYLSGTGAWSYLDRAQFRDMGLEFAAWSPIQYPQLWKEFVPNLSIVDALFNCGPSTGERLFGRHFTRAVSATPGFSLDTDTREHV